MTFPYGGAGFPETEEIVSGEPVDQPVTKPDEGNGKPSLRTVGKGFWLTGAPEKVAKDIGTRWEAQNKGQKTGLARGEVNEQRRQGNPYVKLVKDTDQDTYRVYTPRGIEQAPPSLNKSDDLSVKVVANLYADPPKPDCEPASDNDDDRSSAEFSTRVLMNESTESGMNIPELIWDAEDVACSWGSGFVYAYVDPQGGGHQPREIMAPPEATEVGLDGQPVLEVMGPDGVPVPVGGEPVLRYVAADGRTITDEPDDAQLEWLPRVAGEVLSRKNVRFLPETCSGIRDAEGVLIACPPQTLGALKAKFPAVAAMDASDLRKLVSYRPEITKLLMPKFAGNGEGTKTPDWDASKGPPDDALVFTIAGYMRGSGQYPLGAYAVMGGETKLLHRQEWEEQVRDKGGKMVKRAMDVPVAQFRQFKDTKTNDPHGRGLVDRIGDGDPLTSFAIGAIVEYLHRINNPHVYVPIGSGIQAKSLQLPRGTPIPYNPAGGGTPKQEEIAPLPSAFMDFIQFIRTDQDSVAGLQQAAQGVASASVQSGRHAQQIIEQALVALGGMKQGADSGYMRLCRIVLQLIRKYYTAPRRSKIVGEDGAFKEREWQGTDLGSTVDVKIMAGTSTMMTQSAKEQIALERLTNQAISLEDYQRSITGNTKSLLGLQDNPHKLRVAGQISTWNDGPPENWQPPMVDPNAIDPATGQPLPPPPDPANPFADQRSVDQEQPVALVRHAALARAMSSTKYEKFKKTVPVWAGYLDTAYGQAKQAAGVMTVAEQQQMAQQQAAAQAPPPTAAPAPPPPPPEEEHARVLSLEDHKASKALELEQARHAMAMEAKAVEAELAERAVASGGAPRQTGGTAPSEPSAPAPPARIVLESFDSEAFKAGIEQDVAASAQATAESIQRIEDMNRELEQALTTLAEHAARPQQPIVVQAPDVHVEAPIVNVPAPVVNIPRQPRPQVTVEPSKGKRKGTITGPDGKKYTVEVEDAE